jgi:hypothetical protein
VGTAGTDDRANPLTSTAAMPRLASVGTRYGLYAAAVYAATVQA